MKKEDSQFDYPFLSRFIHWKTLFLMLAILIFGVLCGAVSVKAFNLTENQSLLPMFFAGVPSPAAGLLSNFSTILLNVLIGLIVLFLLGVTAFGAIGIPAFLIYKGISLSVGVLFFFAGEGLAGLAQAVVCYTPAASASTLLLLLFAVRAFNFSNGLAKAGFQNQQEILDFQLYFRDLLYFLCFSVVVSLLGSGFTAVYGLFSGASGPV